MIRRSQRVLAGYEVDPEPIRARGVRLLRRCLSCLVKFESEWAGERICARCKASTRWRTGSGDGAA